MVIPSREVITLPTASDSQVSKALEDVKTLQEQHNLDRQEAPQLLLVSEVNELKDLLKDIEVHTNNAVRKL
jgi:hypothetical protein